MWLVCWSDCFTLATAEVPLIPLSLLTMQSACVSNPPGLACIAAYLPVILFLHFSTSIEHTTSIKMFLFLVDVPYSVFSGLVKNCSVLAMISLGPLQYLIRQIIFREKTEQNVTE